MVGVQVFEVAIDEGWGLGAKGDELARVIVDRVRIGAFLGGVDGGVVGIDGKPGFCGGGSEAGVGAIGPLHWGASIIAAGSPELGDVLIGGEGMTGLHLVLPGDQYLPAPPRSSPHNARTPMRSEQHTSQLPSH